MGVGRLAQIIEAPTVIGEPNSLLKRCLKQETEAMPSKDEDRFCARGRFLRLCCRRNAR